MGGQTSDLLHTSSKDVELGKQKSPLCSPSTPAFSFYYISANRIMHMALAQRPQMHGESHDFSNKHIRPCGGLLCI
jgi:hypothetical protein